MSEASSRRLSLPGGASLAPGERPLVSDRLLLSTPAFYLHTDVSLTDRRLHASQPGTIFGLVPAGTSRSDIPIENIAGISAWTAFEIPMLLIGGFIVALGVGIIVGSGSVLGLLPIVVGGVLVAFVPKQGIEVVNSGGGTLELRLSVFERRHAMALADRLAEAVALASGRAIARTRGGTCEMPADPDTDAAIASLTALARLRERGLIGDEEFAAKRAEILDRF